MFFNFGLEISKILKKAEEERYNLRHPYVGSEHLLLSILKYDKFCIEILKRYEITYDIFKAELVNVVGKCNKNIEINLYTPLLKRIIASAVEDQNEKNNLPIACKDLLLALLEEAEGIAFRLLIGLGVDVEKLHKDLKEAQKDKENLTIMEIGCNLNEFVNMNEKIIGREKEIEQIIEVLLRKKKNNPILVGKAGVGKTAIVEELARLINRKEICPDLQNKTIILLEMGSLVAGTKYRGEFEERLTKIIDEIINNKNIIIFIDEIHTMLNAGGSEGAISASDILKPYLARGDLKIIGATTTNEYDKYLTKDKALERRFEKILIEEPSLEQTIDLLKKIKSEYENFHGLKIEDNVLEKIVELSHKYLTNKSNPDKSIELLDTICSHVKLKQNIKSKTNLNNHLWDKQILSELKEKCLKEGNFAKASFYCNEELKLNNLLKNKDDIKVQEEDILNVIAYKTKMPVLNDLNTLEKQLKNKIVGQDQALEKIILNVKDKINNINQKKSMLLYGPSGVGKTFCAKVLANLYNPHTKLLNVDLKEYQRETSLNKLIGVSAGYIGYNDDYALKQVKDYPYSVLLFDNIEYASSELLNLIFKILDEGIITDAKGEEINFHKCLIIATTKEENKLALGFNKEELPPQLSNELSTHFDDTIKFNRIGKKECKLLLKKYQIIEEEQEKIVKELKLEDQGLRNIDKYLKKIIPSS